MLVFNLSLNMSLSICQCWNFKFKLVFKKMEIPSHIKFFLDKVTANLLPVKFGGPYEAEYQKFFNVNRSFNFAELCLTNRNF
jgi:hypothetical protein